MFAEGAPRPDPSRAVLLSELNSYSLLILSSTSHFKAIIYVSKHRFHQVTSSRAPVWRRSSGELDFALDETIDFKPKQNIPNFWVDMTAYDLTESSGA